MNWTYILALCFVICFGKARGYWNNDYDQVLNFRCPAVRDAIDHVDSVHDNGREDRRFHFRCKRVIKWGTISCTWSNWVNNWDQPVVYNCPNGGYINGWYSYHDNSKEDRRHKFRCCKPKHWPVHLSSCKMTGYLNDWDKKLHYFVPSGHFLHGVHSHHDNRKEDRRFRFNICKRPY